MCYSREVKGIANNGKRPKTAANGTANFVRCLRTRSVRIEAAEICAINAQNARCVRWTQEVCVMANNREAGKMNVQVDQQWSSENMNEAGDRMNRMCACGVCVCVVARVKRVQARR